MLETRFRYPLWSRGDLDGFFGLMVDNLVQVLLIVLLCTQAAGLPHELVWTRILPGVAVSLLIGNLFYGLQAHYVARRDRNPDCTALPYGINTPSVFAFALFIMAPVYRSAVEQGTPAQNAADLAWKAGVLACLVSGAIEFAGAFFAERLRRVTPRAALLGVLAGVGITFIASDFAFRIYTKPLIGLLPLAILLLAYFAHYRFPLRLPGGFLAVVFGTAMAWLLSIPVVAERLNMAPIMFGGEVRASLEKVRWIPPIFAGNEIADVLARPELLWMFLTVSVPMGLLNVLGSLQNIESAEAGGDRFATAPSLAVNGLGSIAAGLFGSCFPTTIYIGHPGWKALGARSGYSILNGLFFTGCFLFGLGEFLSKLIPIEAGAAIVMYIGIVITAQAFQTTPREHAPAVAIALFPAMAALLVVNLPLFMADAHAPLNLAQLVSQTTDKSFVPALPGLVALTGANSSWLVTTLILTAMTVKLIERRYTVAAIWCGAATVLTALGLLHAYRIEGNEMRELFIWQPVPESAQVAYRAIPIAIGYALATFVFALVAHRAKRISLDTTPPPDQPGDGSTPRPIVPAYRPTGLAPRLETNPWK
jgi:AGZA family xanthine/uracil permease-like MFS transporter